MPTLATLAAGAFVTLLEGCQRQTPQHESKPPQPDPQPPVAPEPVRYDKNCLGDYTCEPEKTQAATYDYVGAVYGKKGQVAYDGVLTPEELAYVQKRFGKVDPANQSNYFRDAQELGLSHLDTQNYSFSCLDPSAWTVVYGEDIIGGEGTLLGGVHHCFASFKAMFQGQRLEREIGSRPEDWIFFVEVSQMTELARAKGEYIEQDETAMFHQIAERLGIPVFNPLRSLDSPEVIEEMENQGFSREVLALVMAILKMHEDMASHPLYSLYDQDFSPAERAVWVHRVLSRIFSSEGDKISRETLSNIASVFFMDFEFLLKLGEASLKVPPDREPGEFFSESLNLYSQVLEIWTDVSNELSQKHARQLLEKSGKKHALFQVGNKHHPIMNYIYDDAFSYPPKKLRWLAGSFPNIY